MRILILIGILAVSNCAVFSSEGLFATPNSYRRLVEDCSWCRNGTTERGDKMLCRTEEEMTRCINYLYDKEFDENGKPRKK